jgi:hypothetical protein
MEHFNANKTMYFHTVFTLKKAAVQNRMGAIIFLLLFDKSSLLNRILRAAKALQLADK